MTLLLVLSGAFLCVAGGVPGLFLPPGAAARRIATAGSVGGAVPGLVAGLAGRAAGRPEWALPCLSGALFDVVNHGLFESLLFLGAGEVVHVAGTRDMDRMGGLGRVLPKTALLFLAGAAAISGLPRAGGVPVAKLFPSGARFESHVPDTVLDRAVVPASRAGSLLAQKGRALQSGRLQLYLLYVVATLVALLLRA